MAVRPGRTTGRLLVDRGRLRYGICAWLIISIAYGLVAWIGGMNGLGAVVRPWLPIPAERYYLWMGPFTPLIYLVNFLLLAGSLQLLAKIVRGQGSFEDTFVVVALTFFLPVFLTMWAFEMPVLVFFPQWRRTELGGLGYLPVWADSARQGIGLLWIVVTLTIAVSRVQRISMWRAIPITAVAALLAWSVTLTYLR